MTRFQRERARAEAIVRTVTDDLNGRAVYHSDILDVEPSSKLCIGVLTPPPPPGDPNAGARRSKRKPDSLGFDARVIPDPATQTISGTANVEFLVYYRVVPTLIEQRANVTDSGKQAIREKYRRFAVSVENLPFSLTAPPVGGVAPANLDAANDLLAQACLNAAQSVKGDEDYWPSKEAVKVERSNLENEQQYRASLAQFAPVLANWLGRLDVSCTATNDGYRLSLLVSNAAPMSDPNPHPAQLFDVRLSTTLTSGRFDSKRFAAAALDYRYDTVTHGRGVNAVLEVSEDQLSATASTLPIHWQQRLASRDIGDSAAPTSLAGATTFAALDAIRADLRKYEERWVQFISDNASDPVTHAEATKDLAYFRSEIETFELGIEALRSDDRLLKAFRMMNRAAARHVTQWRLFQIVFIVSMLPSLLARENSEARWRDQLALADVLWFPTGGGKTEAYFGIITAAMFYDRLREKKRGTTAWLRYPLRMLSIQQLQRLVEFVVSADEVRVAESVPGDPFTVGYYVGSANTPNHLTQKSGTNPITALKQKAASGAEGGGIRVLQKCPFCGSKEIDIDIRDDIQTLRIFHNCKNPKCLKQAPICISDSEIYRYLPTVLVGTVDRLARAGETGHFAHIFGQADSRCPQHEYASFQECVESGCKLTKSKFEQAEAIKDPTPALLLQDELHLLKESLGTYDSHYEGYLDEHASTVGTELPSKRLAATATIEGYERHVLELYGRKARRFPSKGIGLLDTPYTRADEDNIEARIYCGILPFGLTTDQVCVRIAKAVHEAAKVSWTSSPADPENSYYDLTLLYGNLKDGVNNMGAALQDDHGRAFARNLSGEHSLDQVREVIDIVERDEHAPYEKRLKTIVATSIISHGVDLERLNVMGFSGFPGRAADYIQASSRVGRKHVGIVFTAYNPMHNIDRSAYVHFKEYHDRLYQLVQPVPVNKFSESAIARTFTGIFSATLLNIMSRIKRSNFVNGNKALSAFLSGLVTEAEMHDRVVRAYGIQTIADADIRAKYEALIDKRTAQARQDLEMGEEWATHRRFKPVPVSSLRKVQEQIGFRIDTRHIRTVEALRRGR